jgi:hypothetical protein
MSYDGMEEHTGRSSPILLGKRSLCFTLLRERGLLATSHHMPAAAGMWQQMVAEEILYFI